MGRAFRRANLLIDTGIPGAPTFRSGTLQLNTGAGFVQWRQFPGRYLANQEYTITISDD